MECELLCTTMLGQGKMAAHLMQPLEVNRLHCNHSKSIRAAMLHGGCGAGPTRLLALQWCVLRFKCVALQTHTQDSVCGAMQVLCTPVEQVLSAYMDSHTMLLCLPHEPLACSACCSAPSS